MSGGRAPDVPNRPPVGPVLPVGSWGIHPTGKVFTLPDGSCTRVRGFTFFKGCDVWLRAGADHVRALLRQYDGFNWQRVFAYALDPGWGSEAWDAPPASVMADYIRWVHDNFPGMQVELCLLTDDDPRRIAWAQGYVEVLADAKLPNLILEAGNEPFTHKRIDIEKMYSVLDNSDYLWASGAYEPEAQVEDKICGIFGNAHTPRTYDFARKAHELWDYYSGAGPDVPHNSGVGRPWVADEPIRPDQIHDLTLGTRPQQLMMYAGTAALLGAGATFHHDAGKYCRPLQSYEQECKRAFLRGLTAFPADAPVVGQYAGTLDEHSPLDASRSYPVGQWMSRVYQLNNPMPQGWQDVGGTDGILCRRA